MNSKFKITNPDLIRRRLESAFLSRMDVSEHRVQELAFHMTDWLPELESLFETFRDIEEVNDEALYEAVLKFALHSPYHMLSAASIITGETVDEIVRPGKQ